MDTWNNASRGLKNEEDTAAARVVGPVGFTKRLGAFLARRDKLNVHMVFLQAVGRRIKDQACVGIDRELARTDDATHLVLSEIEPEHLTGFEVRGIRVDDLHSYWRYLVCGVAGHDEIEIAD